MSVPTRSRSEWLSSRYHVGQLHVPAALPPRKEPVGPSLLSNTCEKPHYTFHTCKASIQAGCRCVMNGPFGTFPCLIHNVSHWSQFTDISSQLHMQIAVMAFLTCVLAVPQHIIALCKSFTLNIS